jgi:hypothetical protein
MHMYTYDHAWGYELVWLVKFSPGINNFWLYGT